MKNRIEKLPDLYEVIKGQIVEVETNVLSTAVTSEIAFKLAEYGVRENRGRAFPHMLVRMPFPNGNERRPNVIFVSYSRYAKDRPLPQDRAWEIVPELCVEVVCPTDPAGDIRLKVDEYFEAGIPVVWVVYPEQELVDIFEPPATIRTLRRSDILVGSGVLEGFSSRISELFFPYSSRQHI